MAKKRAVSDEERLKAKITKALRPGEFIPSYELPRLSFKLDDLLVEVENLADAREAAEISRFFLTAVLDKTEELQESDDDDDYGEDDSPVDGIGPALLSEFLDRRAEYGAPESEALPLVLDWLARDTLGALAPAESAIVETFESMGEAFEQGLLERFRPASFSSAGRILRKFYVREKQVDKYIALAMRDSRTHHDDRQIVDLLEEAGRFDEALAWVEKSQGLADRRTKLLLKSGRVEEAERSALARFHERPGEDTYEILMSSTTPDRRSELHAEAMTYLERARLSSVIELCVAIGERDLLARRIEEATEQQLRLMSHYDTEPAAKLLAAYAPKAAARIFHILALRILDDSKSAYYRYALDHLDCARECLINAGDQRTWDKIVREITEKHYRKPSFKNAFPTVIRGRWIRTEVLTSARSSTSRE